MPNHTKNDERESVPLVTRFFRDCLLALAGVIVLWVALQLLAQIWGWLLLVAALTGLAYSCAWVIRWRRDRRW